MARKRIIIIEHAWDRIRKRGTNLSEIKKVLNKGKIVEAKYPRKAKEMVFLYNKKWQNKFYPEKKVKVIYTEGEEELTVITVYVYFGKWEEKNENNL